MASPSITIIDYGVGNLHNVANACCHLGYQTKVTDKPDDIQLSDLLIIPGVGSSNQGMQGLLQRQLLEAIREYVDRGKPLLGICLGMQLLADYSEEGENNTLGLIPGRIEKICSPSSTGISLPLPNINWLAISVNESEQTDLPITSGDMYYFVHSYRFMPKEKHYLLATTTYGDQEIAAIVAKDNIIGFQFHPEKSGAKGLELLDSAIRKMTTLH